MTREERRYHPILSTFGLGGTQVVFSLFAGQAVLHLKAFGLNPLEIAITLLFGPICGAVFPPYFGSWSDRCQSSWGRRRPFIFWGTAAMAVCMLSLAWADAIAGAVLPSAAAPDTARTVLVLLSMLLTLAVFIAVQAVQVGLRALLTDDATPLRQAGANAWASRHVTFSGFLAYLAAYLDSSREENGSLGGTVFARTSIFTTIYLAITVFITCFYAVDPEMTTFDAPRRQSVANIRLIRRVLTGTSSQIRTIYLVQFFSWLGWFPLLFYTVPYVNSLDESQDSPVDKDLGALTPLLYSAVSIFVTFWWSSQSSDGGASFRISDDFALTGRDIWVGSHCIFGAAMIGTFFVTSPSGNVLLFSMVGISWAVTARVPYSLLGDELSRGSSRWSDDVAEASDHQGLVYGLHNLAICLPQILMMALMGLAWLSMPANDDVSGVVWFLRLGGLSAFAAAYTATRLNAQSVTEEKDFTALALEDLE
ncbi:putative sucrose transport protein [Pestalotiopsis sp. NC0098]|nr:putative sucrose transport protein [Pestalotiopsis sp. NC0098]